MSDDVPPGRTRNPSAWPRRLPLAGLALVGFAIATYLALYQYGVVTAVWEPFFGGGSRVILHSWVSTLLERKLGLPVTDAALGALGYALDAAGALAGGSRRWKTAPWVVLLFGVVVGGMGAGGLVLVVLQPAVFGAACTLCLASAAVSLTLAALAQGEVVASLQYLRRERERGIDTGRTARLHF